jgi:hypothetical protein
MNIEEVVKFFQELIQDPIKLQNGQQIIFNAINTAPQFCSFATKLVITTEVDSDFRKIVGYIMKNILKDVWKTSQHIVQEKQQIKEILIQGLAINQNDLKIVEVISLTMSELIKQDGTDVWEPLLKEIIEWMCNEDNTIIEAALECLCIIFAKTDNRIHVVVPPLMQNLLKMFMFPDLTEKLREKLLILLYLAIQSFSWADGTDKEVLESCFASTYSEWMSLFISSLQTQVKSHINIKRYILKILTVIFRDLHGYSLKSINMCIQPIWKFLNNNLPLFTWTVVFGIPLDKLDQNLKPLSLDANVIPFKPFHKVNAGFELDEDLDLTDDIQGLATQLIELLTTLLSNKNLHVILKFGIFPLMNCMSHYLLMTKEQEKLWVEDPNQFIAEDENEWDMGSIRNALTKLISSLIESQGDDATQAVIIIAEKFLLNLKEESTHGFLQVVLDKLNSNQFKSLQDFDAEKLLNFIKTSHYDSEIPDSVWKKKETGLLLLGTFSEDIIALQAKPGSNFDIATLLQNLLTEIGSTNSNPVLKGRTLWCVSKFADLIQSNKKDIFLPLFKITASCLDKSNYLPVRLCAARALRIIAHKIEKWFGPNLDELRRTEFGINDMNNLLYLVDLIELTSEDTVHFVLEGILSLNKLNPHFTAKTGLLLQPKILDIFKLLHSDMINGPVLLELISLLCSENTALVCVYNAFLTFIVQLLTTTTQAGNGNMQFNPNSISKVNETGLISSMLDVVTIFLKKATEPKQAEDLITMLPPLLNLMIENQDVGLQNHAMVCLKTYITYHSEHILKHNLVPKILIITNHNLQPTLDNESSCLYMGNLIILTFTYLLKNSVDANILKALVSKIYKVKMPSIVQSLVLVFARLINVNEKEMITFLTSFSLDGRPALKVVIDKWLLQQPLFRGKLCKITTCYALTKLFSAKDDRLEQLLVIAYNPSHANVNSQVYAPLKILSLLIRCLDHELSNLIKEPERPAMGGDYKMPRKKMENYDENGRVDTLPDEDDDFGDDDMMDEDDDDYGGEMMDEDDDNDSKDGKIDVGLAVQKDDEDVNDMYKKFNMEQGKDGGLGSVEAGSTFYLSEMLDFEANDEGEADEIAEEDLRMLKDPCTQVDLITLLKEFFLNLIQNDSKYLAECLPHLLKEDKERFYKHFKVKI